MLATRQAPLIDCTSGWESRRGCQFCCGIAASSASRPDRLTVPHGNAHDRSLACRCGVCSRRAVLPDSCSGNTMPTCIPHAFQPTRRPVLLHTRALSTISSRDHNPLQLQVRVAQQAGDAACPAHALAALCGLLANKRFTATSYDAVWIRTVSGRDCSLPELQVRVAQQAGDAACLAHVLAALCGLLANMMTIATLHDTISAGSALDSYPMQTQVRVAQQAGDAACLAHALEALCRLLANKNAAAASQDTL